MFSYLPAKKSYRGLLNVLIARMMKSYFIEYSQEAWKNSIESSKVIASGGTPSVGESL
jgi:hypothetical protein